MKRYLYILMLVTAACSGKVTVTEDEIGADVLYEHDSYKPFSGECIVVFRNTTDVKEQFTYRKGVLNGEALAWYKNGQMRRRGYYHDGQISGKWEFWDENGRKTIEAHYREDILNGSYIALYNNGRIKEKGQFSANKPVGKWAYYKENGQILRSDR